MSRICVDGFNMAMPGGSGIATYGRNLLSAVAELGHEAHFLLSTPASAGPDAPLARDDQQPPARWRRWLGLARRLAPPRKVRPVEIPLGAAAVARDVGAELPAAVHAWAARDLFHAANASFALWRRFTPVALAGAVDVAHWTCPLPLAAPGVANVYTLHDLIPLRLPHLTLDDKRAYHALCRSIARRADLIFTVSEQSRRDIVELLGVDEGRVVNTYQAVALPESSTELTPCELAEQLASFGLEPQGYYLFFGAQEPKKNLRRLVEAYLASGATAPLVIVGPPWLSHAQRRRFGDAVMDAALPPERLLADPRIRRFDFLPLESLRTVLAGARATVFPSLYEGFGLPVLESMLLGVPVITSTEGSLPEIAGDAALLVDPYEVDAIRDAIRTMDADTDLRAELAARGRAQAAKFSPERYRERLRDAYAPVL